MMREPANEINLFFGSHPLTVIRYISQLSFDIIKHTRSLVMRVT